MNERNDSTLCVQVGEDMTRVLDGSASSVLLDHIATCDACRDLRYDVEHGELLMSESGSDFVVPQSLAAALVQAKPIAEETAPITERMPRAATEPSPANEQQTPPAVAPGATKPVAPAKPGKPALPS
ncbi:MAG TPA: hypothetical protein VEX18_18420, partial [Polyangiaceae bacterium]|nr:hypothetical protein [Polyangiaceae bacterium]